MSASPADAFVVHPLIPPGAVARRDYQVAIAHEALRRNTLVILPTGLGKTVVALLVVADRLSAKPGKVLLLAPTKPLAEQHAKFFSETLLDAKVVVLTGETPPGERELSWREATVVCSTPQVVQNDLVTARISLDDVTLVLFDEAHRATGNYAYVFIADAYRRARKEPAVRAVTPTPERRHVPHGLVLALTASPGSKPEKVAEICQNLGVEGVEVRTEHDADTAPYVQDTDVEWKQVAVPESLKRVADLLRAMLDERMAILRSVNAIPAYHKFASKKSLLEAGHVLQARARQEQDPALFQALSAQAAALKLNHALELVETQGVGALESYFERLAHDESKAAKAILADARSMVVRRLLSESRVDHPKLRQVAVLLRQQLKEKPDARILVFTNYRDTSEALVAALAQVEGVRPARFVGQASRSETDRGMSQKKQVEMVEEFKAGKHNVLVATSVAEEGLDIPQTDLVVFYEPVASEIRAIQRRGRTGRRRAGRVVILITKDTRDETYHWASRGKEQKMRKEIDALRQYFSKVNASEETDEWKAAFAGSASRPEKPLAAFETPQLPVEERITIVADSREFAGAVVRELAKMDVVVKSEPLSVGDYVLSDRVAVERKEATDFASSIVDGRLFPQVKALRDAYSSPILLLEGDDFLTARRLSEDAVWGALASIVTDFRVTILYSRNAQESAKILHQIAKREQQSEKRPLAVRGAKGAMEDDERLRFIVEGLPGVSAVLARRLLDAFGTVKGIADAPVEDLMKVEGVGRATAESIHRIFRTQYFGRTKG